VLTDLDRSFEALGFVRVPIGSHQSFWDLRQWLLETANDWLRTRGCRRELTKLEESHLAIGNDAVNEVRLHSYHELNQHPTIRDSYLTWVHDALEHLVGNELAMQRKINLSIQQPGDAASILPLHSDALAGDSPFQVVVWIPLTAAHGSNAMFLLPPVPSHEVLQQVAGGRLAALEDIGQDHRAQLQTIDAVPGEAIIFDSTCLHGNQLNDTTASRWSLNCRFVSVFAPWTSPERRVGSFYSPVQLRCASRIGLRLLDVVRRSAETGERGQ